MIWSECSCVMNIAAIFITHEHSDHITGLRMLYKYHHIPIFVPQGAETTILRTYPEIADAVTVFEPGTGITIGSLTVTSFPTPHDVAASVAYKITDGKSAFLLATDMGYITQRIYGAGCGVSFAMLEANHDVNMLQNGPYPYPLKQRILSDRGHLSNSECGRLCAALAKEGTRHFLLAHLSRENNTPTVAYETVKASLEQEGFHIGEDVFLDVAPADVMTARYIF